MTPRPQDSLPPQYFDQKYDEKLDYWDFETSAYEAEKYRHTLQALPREHYRDIFEIGCSVGVLTALLAAHGERILAVDVAEKAVAAARQRCPQAEVQRMQFPREAPQDRQFDLIVISEVAYYWSTDELGQAQRLLAKLLRPQGDLILVHWISEETDYPLTGREVHRSFRALKNFEHLLSSEHQKYWLDVFRFKGNPHYE